MAITVAGTDDVFALKIRLCKALAQAAPHAGMIAPKYNIVLPMNQFRNVSPMILLMHHTLDLKLNISWACPVLSPAGRRQYAWVDLADALLPMNEEDAH